MRRTPQILPALEVDLGQLGKFKLAFDEVHIEDNDLNKAITEQPSLYAWYSSIEEELTRQLKLKKIEFDSWYGDTRLEAVNSATSKLTVKDLDCIMDSDAECVARRKEIVDIEATIDRVKGYLVALGMRHSVLLELSERERWGLTQMKEVPTEVIGGRFRTSKKKEEN